MFRASVDDQESIEIDFSGDQPVVNGQPLPWDLVRLNDRTFHIIHQNRSYTAEILQLDQAEKTVSLKINQSIHQIKLKDRFDLLLEQMGMSSANLTKINDIKAPMPGLILSLSLQPGDVIRKGDPVLILEAMKMENVIKSPADGTIKTVRINRGQTVEKNQVLVEFQ
ncbi:acetyl-CoA carboxylase biotin carboxyl carrier protein subunit [Larkinella rosea]|uniref:Acetyl-CoA carboxylase biotin carboxyl carrier protein subunit n=1 Tax=Larkinella rosea TaxID=2025312 RepID=A0A3P1BI15_9BACT|nr:acetyl-CoA carboxylase biotin carboxyl carrier protein subunit [Larkinella rosea]RRB00717.1 acetyl-CoA carboxylase biotin carboxyl carrier protein subunit [Larkinella rosea]